MKRIRYWLGSRTGLAVMVSLLVVVALLTIVGSKLGWWSLAARYLSGTTLATAPSVKLLSFTATGERGRTVLEWETKTELNNRGFHVYRAKSGTNSLVQVNSNLIPTQRSGTAGGARYRFDDVTVTRGDTYDYYLHAVGSRDEQVVLGSVTVKSP